MIVHHCWYTYKYIHLPSSVKLLYRAGGAIVSWRQQVTVNFYINMPSSQKKHLSFQACFSRRDAQIKLSHCKPMVFQKYRLLGNLPWSTFQTHQFQAELASLWGYAKSGSSWATISLQVYTIPGIKKGRHSLPHHWAISQWANHLTRTEASFAASVARSKHLFEHPFIHTRSRGREKQTALSWSIEESWQNPRPSHL